MTLAGFSWLFVLPANIRGHVDNPYIGLLVFIAIPVVFFPGLALIPSASRSRSAGSSPAFASPTDRQAAWRRAGIFFAVMTLANIVIGSQVTYRAVEHMETVQFCGQSCHVMKPEFTAHLLPPHQQVACASCHVAPGATGWVQSKMAGTRQLMAVVLQHLSAAHRIRDGEQPTGFVGGYLRAVPRAREVHWPAPARLQQVQG